MDTSELERKAREDGIEKLVVGAVIQEGDRVLLLKRAPDEFMPGLVELPSGGVRAGERLLEAIGREVLEETGLCVDRVQEFIGSFDYTSRSGRRVRQLNFVVSVRAGGEVKIHPGEHTDHLWVERDPDRLSELNVSAETKVTILSTCRQ